jgi:bifunctional UDP-N-acetylglucosamine pyrophosphorylase/glucosamine-1-phosphate N-acetyltransferase
MSELGVIILAAGQGTRMMSKKNKILHPVGGRPMVEHVFLTAAEVAGGRPVLVVPPDDREIRGLFGERAIYVEQREQLGTGHAAQMAAPALRGGPGQVLITYADMPLLRPETLSLLARRQAESGAAVALLSYLGDTASTFGRVLRDQGGKVTGIVEVAEARRRADGETILANRELNLGVYCFDATWMWEELFNLPLRRARAGQEYYLTDMVAAAVSQGRPVEAIGAEDSDEWLGAGTREEMVAVEKAFRRRAVKRWLAEGVTIVDPEATYIDQTVTIGRDTVLWPGAFLQGQTKIGEDCTIGPNAIIRDAQLGSACRVEQAVIEGASLPDGTLVSPFSYISGRGSPERDGDPVAQRHPPSPTSPA